MGQWTFGSTERKVYDPLFVSDDHSRRSPNRTTAGVKSVLPPDFYGLGKRIPDSRRPSSPRFGFGSAKRDDYLKTVIGGKGHQVRAKLR